MRILTLIIALAAVSPTMAQTEPIPAPPPSQTPEQAAAPPKTQDQMPGVNREDFTLPQQPRGRYSFAPVDEGFLRFDHKSGDVTLCRPQATGWSCEPVPDKTGARQNEKDEQNEIGALRDEIATLRKEIASLREPPPSPPPRPTVELAPRPEHDHGMKLELPTKEDLARARGYIEDAWRRLVEMIDNLQKDMKRNSTDESRT